MENIEINTSLFGTVKTTNLDNHDISSIEKFYHIK